MSRAVAAGFTRGHCRAGRRPFSPALVMALLLATSGKGGIAGEGAAAQKQSQPRAFAPGVHIDWLRGIVEVEAVVVLRRGLLELVACSPETREHESILRVAARPLDVFHALGLIGLEPGRPLRHDAATDRWLPPSGPSLRIDVRYLDGNEEKTVPIEKWLLQPEQDRAPDSLPWVFAGSQKGQDGTFGAEVEGTLIGVVDFATALIGIGALHSASDDQLWLAANTGTIPAIGTPCTLMIARAGPRPIVVEVDADGTLKQNGQGISIPSIVQAAVRQGCDRLSGGVVLQVGPAVSAGVLDQAVKAMVDQGLRRETIRVVRPAPASGPATEKTG